MDDQLGWPVLVLVALWDIFYTLWHPGGFGRLSQWVFQLVWRVTKHVVPGRTRQLAGPIGILGVVMLWTGLMVIGWTLAYLPHMPEGFYFGSALSPEQSSDALAALYLSLVTLATLGFGDVTPADPGLRLLTPFEALFGFVLLTAAISWILQVYPALGRRRSVAKRLSILRSGQATDVVAGGEPCVASRMLEAVTEGVIQVETDLLQYASRNTSSRRRKRRRWPRHSPTPWRWWTPEGRHPRGRCATQPRCSLRPSRTSQGGWTAPTSGPGARPRRCSRPTAPTTGSVATHDDGGSGNGSSMTLDVLLIAVGALGVLVAALSARIRRLPLSEPLLALVVGALLGPEVFGALPLPPITAEHAVVHDATRVLLVISVIGVALRYPFGSVRSQLRPVVILLLVALPAMALISTGLTAGILGVTLGSCAAARDGDLPY